MAKIVKINPMEDTDAERRRLLRMEREGRIRLRTGTIPDEFFARPKVADPDGRLLKALLEEREEGR